jgi:hypothetical protein
MPTKENPWGEVRERYREHRIPTSLQRHVGEATTSPAEIRDLVRKARDVGVIVFLKDELERMPAIPRAMIEGEHRRICERAGR